MKQQENYIREINELSKIKLSINEIKRTYQSMDNKLELKHEIKKMIEILDKIYLEIFENTRHLQSFQMYGDFYLPTISKLINRYNNLINKKITSSDVQELLIKIEITIKKLNIHFQNKYNSFFENEIIDLDADIKILLKQLSNK